MSQQMWTPLYWTGLYSAYYANSSAIRIRGITLYSKSHEYIQYNSITKLGRCGLTYYGAKELGDVIIVDFPEVGEQLTIHDAVCEFSNSKDVFSVFSPADGEITKLNGDVIENIYGIIAHPETKGWIWEMKVTKLAENLMSLAEYKKFCDKL